MEREECRIDVGVVGATFRSLCLKVEVHNKVVSI